MSASTETLAPAKDLATLINTWLEGKSYRSQRMLASRTKVGVATINRVVSGQVENKSLSLDIVLKLLPEVTDYDGMLQFLDTHFKRQGDLFKRLFAVNSSVSAEEADKSFHAFLRDPDGFNVLTLVSNHNGVHKSKISALMGERGLNKVQELIEDGIIYEDELGQLKNLTKHWSINDLETMTAQVPFIAQNILRKKKGILTIQSEALNDEGLEKLRALLHETAEKVEKIITNEKYLGDNPIAVNLQQCFLD